MPLIRLLSSLLIALCTFVFMPWAHAEPVLALNTSTTFALPSETFTSPPESLTSARNIRLELIPEIIPDLVADKELASSDLWARIRDGFAMRDLNSPLIKKHEDWYASRPDYVARMTDRARRYLHHITTEVERRGMPSEIALLPMIESAFNPGAYSTSSASGIWQFIPSTGKKFGMQQNWWYDGRRDIISATNGALDYLQSLHDLFGDWELALAAYNWGEGAVQRAQERNRKRGLPTDYLSLKMPDETRNYLPKLMAIKNIVANPASFGLALEDIPNKPYFASVLADKHIDRKLAAQMADIPLEEFIALNPAHNRPVILQENSEFILLPVDKVKTFHTNMENYDKPLVSWQAYQPKKGERLDRLAPRLGLSVERLKSVNSLSGHSNVSTGQTLLVPVNNEENENGDEFETFNMHLHPTPANKAGAIRHTVRKGETLASLARRYHVSVAKLKSWNGQLKQVKAGQTIVIEQTGSRKPSSRQAKRSNASRKRAQRAASPKQASRNKTPKHERIAYGSER